MTVRNGKRIVKERNLYGGYVFIEADLRPEVIHLLSNTTNVIDFLRGRDKGSQPERLRQAEVMRMLGAADELADPEGDEINDYIVGRDRQGKRRTLQRLYRYYRKGRQRKEEARGDGEDFWSSKSLELDNSQVERE